MKNRKEGNSALDELYKVCWGCSCYDKTGNNEKYYGFSKKIEVPSNILKINPKCPFRGIEREENREKEQCSGITLKKFSKKEQKEISGQVINYIKKFKFYTKRGMKSNEGEI